MFYLQYTKPIIEKSIALLLLLFCLPIMILIAVVNLFLYRNVFFIQERAGFQMQSFQFVKFQTMRTAIDLTDIHRMTRFGKFLRASSLDELPQLFQVLSGEMSLIGPRPLLITYNTHYSDEQRKRFDVKPGITGWAQVHGRNKISWENRFQYDNYYVKNVSFKLDMRILVETIFQVLKFSEVNASDEEIMKPFKK
jgi:lipopolysaccharide/colanic/teichoic acid biosynthesis glycosyltransferase